MTEAEKTRNTITHLRDCQRARAAGCRVSFTTDPAWLVEQAVNRRAGWVEEPGYRGTTRPNHIGAVPRKARGDYSRHLRLIAREVNTPRLVVRPARLGEHRWLMERLPDRFYPETEEA